MIHLPFFHGVNQKVYRHWEFHGVEPAANALKCLDCHGVKGRMPWKELGYEADPLNAVFKD